MDPFLLHFYGKLTARADPQPLSNSTNRSNRLFCHNFLYTQLVGKWELWATTGAAVCCGLPYSRIHPSELLRIPGQFGLGSCNEGETHLHDLGPRMGTAQGPPCRF